MTTYDAVSNVPNKAGEAYIKLYHDDWRTSIVIFPTNSNSVDFRGFHGDYDIKIMKDWQVVSQLQFNLKDDTVIDCNTDMVCTIQ